MLLRDDSITKHLHDHWREIIHDRFSVLADAQAEDCLSLVSYLNSSPEKFYSDKDYENLFSFLTGLLNTHGQELKLFLEKHEREVGLALKYLNEINELRQTHEEILPSDDYELILWVDKNINFNYLRLIEGVWGTLILPVAHFDLLERGKDTRTLKQISSRADILKRGRYSNLTDYYSSTIRNGIAHGDVSYSDGEIIFRDNRGNEQKLGLREFVRWFDLLIDQCNGMALALKVFFISKREALQKKSIPFPRQIFSDELKVSATAPGWGFIDALDSYAPVQKKSQLNIYVKNSSFFYSHVLYYCLRTAILAESFMQGYQRYFISIITEKGYPGFAAFDGELLKDFRQKAVSDLATYGQAIESSGIFFAPKYKLPKIFQKVSTLIYSFQGMMPTLWQNEVMTHWKSPFQIRDVRSHRKGLRLVIRDPSLVIKDEFKFDVVTLIRAERKVIVRKATRAARREYSLLSPFRYLPVSYVRVMIYDKDFRKRHLRNSGLMPNLVCTIEVNSSKRIKTIDILGGRVECIGKYRVVWNKNWQQESEES